MMVDKAAPFFNRIRMEGNPVAHANSIVICGRARFTVLTTRLIRLEWSTTGEFEDRGTFAFPNRYIEVSPFSTELNDSQLELKTEALLVNYTENGEPFNQTNLSIRFDQGDQAVKWTPGTINIGNLRGTHRTLDQCAGATHLQEGLLSRQGWSIVDDSGSPVWDLDRLWVEARSDEHIQDWYFFGYGHDYKAALADYIKFGGEIPLVPRYVLGAWWSRFWPYYAQDLIQLVGDFQTHEIPLDVLVVDMDWHTPDGWTGYTWNRQLFPDPPAFLSWIHEQKLQVTLNLHPADGIQKHEEVYPRFAEALGRDATTGEGIKFSAADKTFIQHYFELLHHPLEDQGIDFWWLDWQQGESTEIKGLDPLPWLNHLHFRDSTRRGNRPMLYSRWGGLGNHRYPIGFSGDTYATWEVLRFQTHFTATAANVCYGWWSHDIGGHFGATDPELYARWVQFGAVSPCLRLHSTNDPLAERRPWAFPEPVYKAAKAAIQFRYQLLPYLYSAARTASQRGLSLCYPMYYEYPDLEDAYLAREQYFLGDQMFVAPIVCRADSQTGLAAIDVWIPEGTWIEYTTLETFSGPKWVHLYGDLNRIPMFVRAGAILPTAPRLNRTREFDGSHLVLVVFPAANGQFEFYEDDGTTEVYKQGEYEITSLCSVLLDAATIVIRISAATGNCPDLPTKRTIEVHLRGTNQTRRVMINDMECTDWSYDRINGDLVIIVRDADRRTTLDIVINADPVISSLTTGRNIALIHSDIVKLVQPLSSIHESSEILPNASANTKASTIARSGGPFAHFIDYVTFEDARQQLGTVVLVPPEDASPFDVEIEWKLSNGDGITSTPIMIENCVSQQIIHSPFADEGRLSTFRWSVSLTISWRGQVIPYHYQSQDAYPSLNQWRTLINNPEQQPLSTRDVVLPDGSINTALPWQITRQTLDGTINLKQPFGLLLLEHERQRILSGEQLEAWVSTTINCSMPQDAILYVQCVGDEKCALNGLELTATDPVEHRKLQPMFYSWMPPQATYYRVHLQQGHNELVIHTCPIASIGWWGIGATLLNASGEVLINSFQHYA